MTLTHIYPYDIFRYNIYRISIFHEKICIFMVHPDKNIPLIKASVIVHLSEGKFTCEEIIPLSNKYHIVVRARMEIEQKILSVINGLFNLQGSTK